MKKVLMKPVKILTTLWEKKDDLFIQFMKGTLVVSIVALFGLLIFVEMNGPDTGVKPLKFDNRIRDYGNGVYYFSANGRALGTLLSKFSSDHAIVKITADLDKHGWWVTTTKK